MIKFCPYCKKEFDSNINSQVYCSSVCTKAAYRTNLKEKECQQCGEKYMGKYKEKFCGYCKKQKQLAYNRNPGLNIAFALNYCPYQKPEFLKTWEGRVPNPNLGF